MVGRPGVSPVEGQSVHWNDQWLSIIPLERITSDGIQYDYRDLAIRSCWVTQGTSEMRNKKAELTNAWESCNIASDELRLYQTTCKECHSLCNHEDTPFLIKRCPSWDHSDEMSINKASGVALFQTNLAGWERFFVYWWIAKRTISILDSAIKKHKTWWMSWLLSPMDHKPLRIQHHDTVTSLGEC